jgi:hypothetical protein
MPSRSVVTLAAEPAAGTGLNVRAVFRLIESMSLTGLALLVLVLLVFSYSDAPLRGSCRRVPKVTTSAGVAARSR